ncbi:thiol peroxidase [Streptococcus ictaluri]|uniref:Thiol peroxidase n=1 Tax=Streptococcus ictaluri 707-05 TaxID=764299 RepID=G5K2T5_9STRE|nr:thiol peroxidase [Streptococcus ictaluri]EHI69719.1 redoxin [Streptococcus ictaluri 707-05]
MTTFKGQEVTLVGSRFEVGDTVPDFTLMASDLSQKSLHDFKGKKIISVVPSIDTGICSTQTRTFNQAIADKDDCHILTVSVDLPFAQARWCGVQGLDKAIMLSDYYDYSFGKSFGLLIEEWHFLARAVLILDENNKVVYIQYLDNINEAPDYEAALRALEKEMA